MIPVSEELLSKIIKKSLSRGGDYADVFIEHTASSSVQIEDNKLEKLVSGIDAGIGIRAVLGDKTAYAYSNDFSEGSLLDLADTVSKVSASENKDAAIDLRKSISDADLRIKLNPQGISIDKKISLLKTANKAAWNISPKIKQVSLIYRDTIQDVCIAASNGTIARDNRIYTLAVIQVVATDGDVLQTGYEPVGGFIGFELFDEVSLEGLAVKAAEKAVRMLSARKASGGRMPVVISSEAGGTMIHEAIGHGLEADLIQQGLSVYADKIGKSVASPIITVVDDSTISQKRGSFRFDDEGVPSQKTVLVENGVLKNYMYDMITSRKDRTHSTGNGRRESYRHRPIPRMTNTFIAPGNSSPHEIIRSVDKGLFVKKMGGGQVNTATGEFLFEVSEGYTIEKGNLAEPLRGATLIGNGPDVLMSIDMVGNDLGFSIGTCGKDMQGVPVSDAMPTVRIPEIVVGGIV